MSRARRGRAAARLREKAERLERRMARLQQRRPFLAVAFGTYKKFSDDQAGYLAALIAYYGFASLLPLLLVLIAFLELVARSECRLFWPTL